MKLQFKYVFALSAVLLLVGCKELQPALDQVKKQVQQQQGEAFSQEDMIAAIKQALSQGIDDSIELLSKAQGFNIGDAYRIPLPEKLQKPADLLRKFGQDKLVDDMEQKFNDAAKASIAAAGGVFGEAISNMSVADAVKILEGEDNAATQYFRETTESDLREKFKPIISTATSESGLAKKYKSFSKTLNTFSPGNEYAVDLDEYVLGHSIDALFDRIAVEEASIREDPLKRSTELMQKVFSYFQN